MDKKCEATGDCPVYKMYSLFSSSEAGTHLLNAKKELLLAVKSLVEKEIERTDKAGKSKRARKVKIG